MVAPFVSTEEHRRQFVSALFRRLRKWFRCDTWRFLSVTIQGLRPIVPCVGEDDSTMLKAILIMLGMCSCALVLVAFWGTEVLGSKAALGAGSLRRVLDWLYRITATDSISAAVRSQPPTAGKTTSNQRSGGSKG